MSKLSLRDRTILSRADRVIYDGIDESMTRQEAEDNLERLAPPKPAEAQLTTRVARDRWKRTAVIVDGSETLDLVDTKGNLIAHLVLHVFEPGHADIDIVLSPDVQRERVEGVVVKAHPTHDYQARVLRFPGCVRQASSLEPSEGMIAFDFHYPIED